MYFFIFFLLNIILPLYDLPLVGLSLTAPLMLIIAIQVILKPSKPWFDEYKLWWALIGLIWLSWFITAVLNSFLGRLDTFSSSQILYFVRVAYWLIVMVITVYVVSQKVNGLLLLKIINFGMLVLGVLRLVEAVFFRRIGAGSAEIFTQNTYGILFSTFALFPVILLIEEKGFKKIYQFFVVIIIFSALILNASRSNWIAIVIGLVALFYLLIKAHRIKIFALISFLAFIVLIFLVLILIFSDLSVIFKPDSPVVQRFTTFQNLDQDVSFGTRQYLVNKALAQFDSSPIIGIGIERGRYVFMDVEVPDALKYEYGVVDRPINEHNSYVQLLAETGLVGTIPFAMLVTFLLLRGFKAASYLSKENNIWAAAVFASFISMSIHMWAITVLRNSSTWVLYGVVGGMIVFAQKHQAAKTEVKT